MSDPENRLPNGETQLERNFLPQKRELSLEKHEGETAVKETDDEVNEEKNKIKKEELSLLEENVKCDNLYTRVKGIEMFIERTFNYLESAQIILKDDEKRRKEMEAMLKAQDEYTEKQEELMEELLKAQNKCFEEMKGHSNTKLMAEDSHKYLGLLKAAEKCMEELDVMIDANEECSKELDAILDVSKKRIEEMEAMSDKVREIKNNWMQ